MKHIGTIVNTKGLKGEVKILSSSDFKDIRFAKNNKLYLKQNLDYDGDDLNQYRALTVSSWYTHKTLEIVKFQEYNSINEVQEIINEEIYGENLGEENLSENEYYFDDLLNYEVWEKNLKIGKIIDVYDQVNRTYLKIEKENKKVKVLPFVDEFIKFIDETEQKVEIETIEGLLDD